jgi:hypothetical protein
MGKRSNFERVERDFYPTPYEAVVPLLPHLPENTWFDEPCAGDGALVAHLKSHGHVCDYAGDIEPRADWITRRDALDLPEEIWHGGTDFFITNPPWDRKILHPLILSLSDIAPTWLLFDADWMHTKQSEPFMGRCQKIVSVGRVKWIPDSTMTGKDNCAWYLFTEEKTAHTEFYGRMI